MSALSPRLLLELELQVLSGTDDYGREAATPLVVVAGVDDLRLVHAVPEVPDGLVRELRSGWIDLTQPPPGMAAVRSELADGEPMELWGGPSYVLSPLARKNPQARLATSDHPAPSALVNLRPQPWPEPTEWADLLEGRLGPWAIAHTDDQVLAVCHTPRARMGGAEAGVWTHPEHRRRGLAAEVTLGWAAVAQELFAYLFYSASSDNRASHGVARRLGARPIGWTWKLRPLGCPRAKT